MGSSSVNTRPSTEKHTTHTHTQREGNKKVTDSEPTTKDFSSSCRKVLKTSILTFSSRSRNLLIRD